MKYKGGRSYGNAWLYATLISWLKAVDVKVFYVFSNLCIVPITLLLSRGARMTYRYYHLRKGFGWLKSVRYTYRNHCIFSQTVIDKFAMYAGRKFKFAYEGLDFYNDIQQQPNALLQLSAHIGCSEILGYTLQRTKAYNVLVDSAEQESLMAYRSEAFANTNIKMIPVGNGSGSSEKIEEAFERGEIIGAFADRYVDPKKIITSTLYNNKVKLAKGPFSLAVARGIDVVMVNAMKERDGSYRAFFTPLHYDKTLTHKQQRQQLADSYTAEIERLLDRYPEQWFNYFELWEEVKG